MAMNLHSRSNHIRREPIANSLLDHDTDDRTTGEGVSDGASGGLSVLRLLYE
jgi:hypothetical protein